MNHPLNDKQNHQLLKKKLNKFVLNSKKNIIQKDNKKENFEKDFVLQKEYLPLNNKKNYLIFNNIMKFIQDIKILKKNQILYIFDNYYSSEYIYMFYLFLLKNNNLLLKKWPDGFITNFYQLCKTYKHKKAYEIMYNINLNQIKYIFIDVIPDQKSNKYKELLLLKNYLNIKIISLVDIEKVSKKDLEFIDIPLLYSNKTDRNYYPNFSNLIFFLVKIIKN